MMMMMTKTRDRRTRHLFDGPCALHFYTLRFHESVHEIRISDVCTARKEIVLLRVQVAQGFFL